MKKILHIVSGLDMGGIEKWLCNIFSYKEEFENIEFYIFSMHPTKKNIVDKLNISTKNIFFTKRNSVLSRMASLIKVINEINPDIIHIHTGYSSGIYAAISRLVKKKSIVIIHSHSDRRLIENNSNCLRKIYIRMMKKTIQYLNVKRISVSIPSGISLYDKNFRVMYCGIKCDDENISIPILNELKNKKLIFHIGRYTEAKNFPFIIELMKELKYNCDIKFVFIGSELNQFQEILLKNNIQNGLFLGEINNPYALMKKYANLFILPSKWEGLPLSAIESQLANVPTLISSNVTEEANIGLASFLPLNLVLWKEKILESINLNVSIENLDYDKFSIKNNINSLKRLYNQ
nr:glycosyltransferase [Providencia rettgeri]